MTENLPAISPQPHPEREHLVSADTDGWTSVLPDVIDLARAINDTDFVPAGLRKSVAGTAAAILYGREVGLGPMTTLQSTYVVHGKVGVSAEIMRAMVFSAGHQIVFEESTGATCRVRGRRNGSDDWQMVQWTIDDAKRAGLVRKDSGWISFPRRMLQARASSELCQMVFPDVIHGFVTVEELEDAAAANGQPPADTSTTVQRKGVRGRQKPQQPAAIPPPADSAEPATVLPPLPGEPGYTDDEATPEDGSAADVPPIPAAAAEPPTAARPDDADGDVEVLEPAEPRILKAQQHGLFATFHQLGIPNDDAHRDERLQIMSVIIGRPITTSNDLTRNEARTLFETFAMCHTREDLDTVVANTQQYALDQPRAEADPPADPDQPAYADVTEDDGDG